MEAEDQYYSCNGTGRIYKNCQHKPHEISCYNSSKMGHVVRECREQKETCYVCHHLGHISQDCANSERKNWECYNCGHL
ncbi:hypothetical protein HPB48_016656 [Haemaphysalis longicornis]|uniref:CCHC-type domain-containing protein n=1 Tax=Haemaphysalis longicornis TaxID=44386 RepID=A0A9J6GTB0_HAELO|nr:hypothetical protein HPB48_016656 [Haemaphysalis longicornis]